MRALATGDLHLGKGATYADDRLGEQEQVWRSILGLAVAEGCDAVLVAGDIFEGPLPTPEHYEAFARPLRDFPEMPVVAILGNGRHDAAMRATTALQVLEAPELRIVTRPEVVHVGGASVCCLPWAPVSRLVAARGGGDRDEVHIEAVEYLLAVARGLRAQAVGPAVLLLHWSISGASLPNGLPVDLAREPILPVEELEALGFDAAIGGHIHKAQPLGSLAPDDELMPIFYVGSPMPLDFSEAGYAHGVWLLDVEPGRAEARFVPLESRRFVEIEDVLVGDDAPHPAGWDDWPPLTGAIVKVTLHATRDQARCFTTAGIRRALEEAGAHRVHQVSVKVEAEQTARVQGLSAVDDTDALRLYLAAQGVTGDEAARLVDRAAAYIERVPA